MGSTLNENIAYFKKILDKDDTIIYRIFESKCGNLKCCLVYVEGMVSSKALSEEIITPIQKLTMETLPEEEEVLEYLKARIIHSKYAKLENDRTKMETAIYYGDSLLIVDGTQDVLIIDTKGWEKRGISEPTSERTLVGPRESFTEVAITNLSMVRRRILDSSLKIEGLESGETTHTKVYMLYIDKVAPPKLVEDVRMRLNAMDIEAVMEIQYIIGCISENSNAIFKLTGQTQRPDVIAAKLIEGKVAICCDGSAEMVHLPYLFYENFLFNEDYYDNYVLSAINRCLRIIAWIVSTTIPGVYISLIAFHQQMLPTEIFISIAAARKGVPMPSILELALLLITFEIIREAGTRMPQNIGNAISIVGTLILGEAAVRAEIVSAPVVIISALSGITSLMLPRSLQGMAMIRFFLLFISALFGLYGFVFGASCISIYLFSLESFGVPYMTFIYNLRKSKDSIIRMPWVHQKDNVKNIFKK